MYLHGYLYNMQWHLTCVEYLSFSYRSTSRYSYWAHCTRNCSRVKYRRSCNSCMMGYTPHCAAYVSVDNECSSDSAYTIVYALVQKVPESFSSSVVSHVRLSRYITYIVVHIFHSFLLPSHVQCTYCMYATHTSSVGGYVRSLYCGYLSGNIWCINHMDTNIYEKNWYTGA